MSKKPFTIVFERTKAKYGHETAKGKADDEKTTVWNNLEFYVKQSQSPSGVC